MEIIADNWDEISDEENTQWIQFIRDTASRLHSSRFYDREREYLRLLLQIKSNTGERTGKIEESLIKSYRLEANVQETNSMLAKADTLRSGLNECSQYMSDSQRQEWKREALRARRDAVQTEFAEIDLGQMAEPESNVDSLDELVTTEIKQNTTRIVDQFIKTSDEHDSTFALYNLLLSESLIPDATRIRLKGEEFVFQNAFTTKIISPEYNTLSLAPGERREIPTNYHIPATGMMSSTGNALHQLIQQGHLSVHDFITIFRLGGSLSADTDFFLVEALFDLFDGNHVQALFVSLPHLEAIFVDTLPSLDRTSYINTEKGTQQRTLGGLISETTELLGQDYSIYLRFRYTDRAGMNLRNGLSHGQLRRVNANYLNSVMVMFDISKSVIHLNRSAYVRAFGPPFRAFSPPTNFNKDTDLSLFTDANRQIVGYGRPPDRHSIIVIRKNANENSTKLFVDRGRISEYELGSADMTREKLSTVEELSAEYADVPEEIDYTWLDNETVLRELLNIVETNLTSDQVEKQLIFQQARKRGISEVTARLGLDQLEETHDIVQSDETVSLNGTN